ncbi:carcinoembryonic antigen-related cell adhesion molecule 6-like [Heptranchias perlo]|uniref:carcinoembryonic antigen-related cell adhesion molecule 6-like n=1 Tax=Heptranchias perlo TaxID=212740 RepID=UPI00355A1D28
MGHAATQDLACLFVLIASWLFRLAEPVSVTIVVERNPVQTGVGWNTTLSVANASELYRVEWKDPTGGTILTRFPAQLIVKGGTRYVDRVQLHPNGSLAIASANRADEGDYTVSMESPGGVNLTPGSRAVTLLVYEQIRNVSITVSTADVLEGQPSVTLTCTVRSGTRMTFTWEKDNAAVTNSTRVAITGSVLAIQQVRRGDTGSYTCHVENAISRGSNTQSLTVYYGPESTRVQKEFNSDCVVPDQVILGRSGRFDCQADSVPPAQYSWVVNGQAQHQGSSVNISGLTSEQAGNYTCIVRNIKTARQDSAYININSVDYCLSIGAVVGIAIGGLAALLLLILLIVLLVRCKRTEKKKVLTSKKPMRASTDGNAKVLPWINNYPTENRSISPTPVYHTDQTFSYSYPPSIGSMVASTVDGRMSIISQDSYTGKVSTLV